MAAEGYELVERAVLAVGLNPTKAVAGDFNGDGVLDVAASALEVRDEWYKPTSVWPDGSIHVLLSRP